MLRLIIGTLILAFTGISAHAEESLTEKASAKTNDAKRGVKKGVHRVGETLCMKGDVECFAEKAKNRAVEGKDYVKDKAVEAKDVVDADKDAND